MTHLYSYTHYKYFPLFIYLFINIYIYRERELKKQTFNTLKYKHFYKIFLHLLAFIILMVNVKKKYFSLQFTYFITYNFLNSFLLLPF